MVTRMEMMEPRKRKIYPLPGEDPIWDSIQADCRRISAEMLEIQMKEFAEWDSRPRNQE